MSQLAGPTARLSTVGGTENEHAKHEHLSPRNSLAIQLYGGYEFNTSGGYPILVYKLSGGGVWKKAVWPRKNFPSRLHRWNIPEEVLSYLISFNYHEQWVTTDVSERPPSGTILFFNRQQTKHYRSDGYDWKTRGSSKSLREDRMKLKVFGQQLVCGCYSHRESNPNFHRRCYWLLQNPQLIMVHYLETDSLTRKATSFCMKAYSGSIDQPQAEVPQCCLEPADVCLLPVGDKNLCRLVFEAVNVPVFLNELSTTIGDIAGHFSSTGAAIEYINKLLAANGLSPLQELPDIPAMLINTAVSTLTLQAVSSQQGQRCLLPKSVIPPTVLLQTAKYFLLNKNCQPAGTTGYSPTNNQQLDPLPPLPPPASTTTQTSAEIPITNGSSNSSDLPNSLVPPLVDLPSLIAPLDAAPSSNTKAFNSSTFSSFAKSLLNLDPMMTVNLLSQQQQYPEQQCQIPCPSIVDNTVDDSPMDYTPQTPDLPLNSEALLALADNLLHNMTVEGLVTSASSSLSPLCDSTTFHPLSSTLTTTTASDPQSSAETPIGSDGAQVPHHYSLPVNGICPTSGASTPKQQNSDSPDTHQSFPVDSTNLTTSGSPPSSLDINLDTDSLQQLLLAVGGSSSGYGFECPNASIEDTQSLSPLSRYVEEFPSSGLDSSEEMIVGEGDVVEPVDSTPSPQPQQLSESVLFGRQPSSLSLPPLTNQWPQDQWSQPSSSVGPSSSYIPPLTVDGSPLPPGVEELLWASPPPPNTDQHHINNTQDVPFAPSSQQSHYDQYSLVPPNQLPDHSSFLLSHTTTNPSTNLDSRDQPIAGSACSTLDQQLMFANSLLHPPPSHPCHHHLPSSPTASSTSNEFPISHPRSPFLFSSSPITHEEAHDYRINPSLASSPSRGSISSLSTCGDSYFDQSDPPSVAELCELLGDSQNVQNSDFSHLSLSDSEQHELLKASRIIQNAFRRHRARNRQQMASKEKHAALLIERHYKQYKELKRLRDEAARRIQHQYRQYRKRHQEVNRAALFVQQMYRYHKMRKRTSSSSNTPPV